MARKCTINTKGGQRSDLAKAIFKAMDNDLRTTATIHSAVTGDNFKKWYTDGEYDKKGEPVLKQDKDGNYGFYNADNEFASIASLSSLLRQNEGFKEIDYKVEDNEISNDISSVLNKKRKQIMKTKDRVEKVIYDSNFKTRESLALAQLLSEIEEADAMMAFDGFFGAAITKLRQLNYNLKYLDQEETNEAKIKKLRRWIDQAAIYEDIADMYELAKKLDPNKEHYDKEYYDKVIAPTIAAAESINARYRIEAKNALAEKLFSITSNPDLKLNDIKNLLTHANSDISWFSMMMDSMGESQDSILALVDKLIKDARYDVKQHDEHLRNAVIQPIYKELMAARAASPSDYRNFYDFMLEKKEGQLTGNIITTDKLIEDGYATDSAEYRFLEMYIETMSEAVARIPGANPYNLPAIFKQSDELRRDAGVIKFMKERFRQATKILDDDEDYQTEVFTDNAGREIRFLPVKFTMRVGLDEDNVNPEDISLNLINSLSKFSTMAKNYEAMSEIKVYVEAAKDLVVSGRDVANKGRIDRFMKKRFNEEMSETVKGGNAGKALDMWLKTHFYGEKRVDELKTEGGISGSKIVDGMISLTAIKDLSLNFFSGGVNAAMGNLQNRLEASGELFYDGKDLRKANARYFRKHLKDFTTDAYSQFTSSTIGRFIDKYDMEQNTSEYGRGIRDKADYLKSTGKALRFMQSGPEHQIQISHMLAHMEGHRFYNGSLYSYMEWLDETKKPRNKETKKEFRKLKSMYEGLDKTEDGRIIIKNEKDEATSEEEIRRVTQRIKAHFRITQGNYSAEDKINMKRYWWGRALMLYRSWMKPGWNRRWKKKYHDEEMGIEMEGNYQVAARFTRQLFQEMKDFNLGLLASRVSGQYDKMSAYQKRQIAKTGKEMVAFIGILLLGSMLAFDDEDDENGLSLYGRFLTLRMAREMAAYVNPLDALAIMRSPTALTNTIEQIWGLTIGAFDQYADGTWKFDDRAVKFTPILGQLVKVSKEDNIRDIVNYQSFLSAY